MKLRIDIKLQSSIIDLNINSFDSFCKQYVSAKIGKSFK